MATVKLTQAMRDSLVSTLLRRSFDQRRRALYPLRAALARDIYEGHYSAAERAQMEALPKGWLAKDDDVKFSMAGHVDRFRFNGWDNIEYLPRELEVPEVVHRLYPVSEHDQVIKVFDKTDHEFLRWKKIEAEKIAIEKGAKELGRQLRDVFSQASTVARLVALWPEVEPFVQHLLVARPAPTALVVPTAQLNRLLDLPIPTAS